MKKQGLINKSEMRMDNQIKQGKFAHKRVEMNKHNCKENIFKMNIENSPNGLIFTGNASEYLHPFNAIQTKNIASCLQQNYGNTFLQRVIQAKPKSGKPDDIYEKNADRVAEAIFYKPDQNGQKRNNIKNREKSLKIKPPRLQIMSLKPKHNSNQKLEFMHDIESRFKFLRHGGQPLPSSELKFFEPRLCCNLRGVRIHTDSNATELTHLLNARAFTIGNIIAFGAGEYSPKRDTGKRLLAHELVHVIQQAKSYPMQTKRIIHENILPFSPVTLQLKEHKGGTQNISTVQKLISYITTDLKKKILGMKFLKFRNYILSNGHIRDLKKAGRRVSADDIRLITPILNGIFEEWLQKNEGSLKLGFEINRRTFRGFVDGCIIPLGFIFDWNTYEVIKIRKHEEMLHPFENMPNMEIAYYLSTGLHKKFGSKIEKYTGIAHKLGKQIEPAKQLEMIAEVIKKRSNKYSNESVEKIIISFLNDMYPTSQGYYIVDKIHIIAYTGIKNPHNFTLNEENALIKGYKQWWENKLSMAPKGYDEAKLDLGAATQPEIDDAKRKAWLTIRKSIQDARVDYKSWPTIEYAAKVIDKSYLGEQNERFWGAFISNVDRIAYNLIFLAQDEAKDWIKKEIDKIIKTKKSQ